MHIVEQRHQKLGDLLKRIVEAIESSNDHPNDLVLFSSIIDSILELTVLMMQDVEYSRGGDADLRKYVSMRLSNTLYSQRDKMPVFSYHRHRDAFVLSDDSSSKATRESLLLTIFKGIVSEFES